MAIGHPQALHQAAATAGAEGLVVTEGGLTHTGAPLATCFQQTGLPEPILLAGLHQAGASQVRAFVAASVSTPAAAWNSFACQRLPSAAAAYKHCGQHFARLGWLFTICWRPWARGVKDVSASALVASNSCVCVTHSTGNVPHFLLPTSAAGMAPPGGADWARPHNMVRVLYTCLPEKSLHASNSNVQFECVQHLQPTTAPHISNMVTVVNVVLHAACVFHVLLNPRLLLAGP